MSEEPIRPIKSSDFKVERFGILNTQGQFWTPDTFDSPEAARAHVVAFWRGTGRENEPAFLARFRVVPVMVTVEALTPEQRND